MFSLDAVVSKPFGIAGTWRLEPYLGWDALLIERAERRRRRRLRRGRRAGTNPANAAAVAALPPGCRAQAGSSADFGGNFRFPSRSLITRSRWFGGAKLKLWKLFLVGQFSWTTAGGSRDPHAQMGAADDQSGSQKAVRLSFGLDL